MSNTRIPLVSIHIAADSCPTICGFASNTFIAGGKGGLHLEYDTVQGVVYCTAPGRDEEIVPITAITVMRKLTKKKKVEEEAAA